MDIKFDFSEMIKMTYEVVWNSFSHHFFDSYDVIKDNDIITWRENYGYENGN